MIGISFAYPDAADKFRGDWNELRVARIQPGPDLVLKDGRTVAYYWRLWVLPLEERIRLMDDVVKTLIRDHKVDGFTLWWNWTKKVWQMNVRRAEGGWSVSYISQAQAEAIFATLEASHPDGPWKVRPDYVQDDSVAAKEVDNINNSSAHARAERIIEDLFDRTILEPSLEDAFRAAEEAVERSNRLLARWMPE